jgi:monoamine oxidase
MEQASKLPYATSPYKHGTNDYLTILKWFGSIPNQAKAKDIELDIAVVGAGMSGLVAGYLLRKAGHDVHFYEASSIVGGRVKTLRDRFTSGFYAEAGAMRIPPHHMLTLSLIKSFGLSCLDFPIDCPNKNALFYINNIHCPFHEYDRSPPDFGFGIRSKKERGKSGWKLLEDSILQFLRQKEKEKGANWHDMNFAKLNDDRYLAEVESVLRYIDQYSFNDFLHEAVAKKILSSESAKFICAVLALEMSLNTSMAYMLHMLRTLFAAKLLYQIESGMDLLPRAFVGQRKREALSTHSFQLPDDIPQIDWLRNVNIDISDKIEFNTRVIELSYGDSHVTEKGRQRMEKLTVHFENVVLRQRRQRNHDLVILALPFSALRHVRMKDLAGLDKRRALRQLHYDNACKVLLEFNEAFWTKNRAIKGGKSIADLPVRQIFYPNPHQNKSNVLLASYTWGDDSLRWTSLNDDDRLRFALRDIARVHEEDESELRDKFVGGDSHSWAEHEFTSGAFAVFEPHQCNELFDHIWKPEGRVHYCGEHTSTKHGWMRVPSSLVSEWQKRSMTA